MSFQVIHIELEYIEQTFTTKLFSVFDTEEELGKPHL